MRLLPGLAALSIPAMAVAAPLADIEASPALTRSARQFADITVRLKIGEGKTDKVVYLTGAAEALRVISIEVMPSADNGMAEKPDTVAILRTRAQPVERPTEGDRSFAERRRVSVFIVGEWRSPAPMWEVGRHDGKMVFRTIDKDGVAGAWQSWP